jgi:hypothetical protein
LQEVSEGRGLMFSLLNNINRYYKTADGVTRGTDAMAVQAAMEVVLAHGRRDIAEFRRRDDAFRNADDRTSAQTYDTFPPEHPTVDWTSIENRLADAIGSVLNWFRRQTRGPQ